MQTFLPYPSFARSARSLDNKRLFKQVIEAKQILRALYKVSAKGWTRHPATQMWRGFSSALCAYHNACLDEVNRRGSHNHSQKPVSHGVVFLPPWFGDPAFHRAHKSNLYRKDSTYYKQWSKIGPDLPYLWPSTDIKEYLMTVFYVDKEQLSEAGSLLQKKVKPNLLQKGDTIVAKVSGDYALLRVLKVDYEEEEIGVEMYDFDSGVFDKGAESDYFVSWDEVEDANYFKVLTQTSYGLDRTKVEKDIAQLEEILSLFRKVRLLEKKNKKADKSKAKLQNALFAFNPKRTYTEKQIKWLVEQNYGAIHRSRLVHMKLCTVYITELDGSEYVGLLTDIELDRKTERHATYSMRFGSEPDEYEFSTRDYEVEESGQTLFFTRLPEKE